MKIAVSGASGIGKTTIAIRLAAYWGCAYIPDTIDLVLREHGYQYWPQCDSEEEEREIRLESLERKIGLESAAASFVSDKGAVDHLAYWLIHCSAGATEDENVSVLNSVRDHVVTYSRVVIPVFGVYPFEESPRRFSHPLHRLRVHALVKGLYESFSLAPREADYPFATPIAELAEDLGRRRAGLYMGAFDPIHHGHLRVAQAATSLLDDVWIQPHPDQGRPRSAPLEHRATMIALATQNTDRMRLRVDPLTHPQESYRTDAVLSAADEFRGNDLWVVMGSDKLAHPAYDADGPLLDVPHLIHARDPLTATDRERLRAFRRARIIHRQFPTTSATAVRVMIEGGQDVHGMLHEDVIGYIAMHRLYQGLLAVGNTREQ
ncbi:MAG: AAA family ATPase [Candidatus Aenigmarchaeota archaeon]|nr:AAA family ATPase [Candidatus Aenigmarchaeota archaeon]